MAAALTEMTAGRVRDDEVASRAAELRAHSLSLAESDSDAVAAVLASGPDDHSSALSRATEVPLAIAEAAAQTAALAMALTGGSARAAAADAEALAELAEAGMRAAARLVLANLGAEANDPRVARAQSLLRAGSSRRDK
jgi:formiminotetrahydrofolate cyclodeaminase